MVLVVVTGTALVWKQKRSENRKRKTIFEFML